MAETAQRGVLDTNVVVLRRWIDPAELPAHVGISAVTLAELSAGPHMVRTADVGVSYDEAAERARRVELLQRVENEFDPIPFGTEAARVYGRLVAAVVRVGRQPRRRVADLMIAATAVAEGLTLYTTNPDDFNGLETHLQVAAVTRPRVPCQP